MRRAIRLSFDALQRERPEGATEDVHFTEALVEAVVADFSRTGDRVLDPFAGYGTTLVVSERMGRVATGVELLPERVSTMRRRLTGTARVMQGDSRRLGELGLGSFELCLTSPPYMTAAGHLENPLTGYATRDGAYPRYLTELTDVFGAVAEHLVPGGHLVINAATIRTGDTVTALAQALTRTVARHLDFRGEIRLEWDRLPAPFASDHCLVFRRR